MTDPVDIALHWIEEREDGYVTKAHVVITLPPPSATPDALEKKLLFKIEGGEAAGNLVGT
jgi:hypothetical protein